MNHDLHIILEVPYKEKNDAKALGARWDPSLKKWYIFKDSEKFKFYRWIPREFSKDIDFEIDIKKEDNGFSLSEYLIKIGRVLSKKFDQFYWIRGEINGYAQKNGHVYFTLVERNNKGEQIASVRAQIWKNDAITILKKFKTETGNKLHNNIKIMFYARASFHVSYGFSLQIKDVDPTYTLGDMAQKLANIRNVLKYEKIYVKNKILAKPEEFVHVAVISPKNAAGLGDFQREANKLESLGLCRFKYFNTLFQGIKAPNMLIASIKEVVTYHEQNSFDALVIIRGGGAAIDLAWLNDLELARYVCNSPIPIISGIGHERDNTIIDEVSCLSFDTPSKVSHFIFEKIYTNALEANKNLQRIKSTVNYILSFKINYLDKFQKNVIGRSEYVLSEKDKDIKYFSRILLIAGDKKLVHITDNLGNTYKSILKEYRYIVNNSKKALYQYLIEIFTKTENNINATRTVIQNLAEKSYSESYNKLNLNNIELEVKHLIKNSFLMLKNKVKNTDRIYVGIMQQVIKILDFTEKETKGLLKQIINLGPSATLRRGFVIVRNKTGQVIASKQTAKTQKKFLLSFKDGEIYASNLDFEEKNGRK